jgi:hypothetical protein
MLNLDTRWRRVVSFTLRETTLCPLDGGYVGYREILDAVQKRYISCLHRESNLPIAWLL